MATSETSFANPVGSKYSYEEAANNGPKEVATSSTNVFQLFVDARLNPTENVYLRLYNASSAPTVGTTDVFMVIPVRKGTTQEVTFRKGVTFGTGIFVAVVTNKGSAGDTSPSGVVDWHMRRS